MPRLPMLCPIYGSKTRKNCRLGLCSEWGRKPGPNLVEESRNDPGKRAHSPGGGEPPLVAPWSVRQKTSPLPHGPTPALAPVLGRCSRRHHWRAAQTVWSQQAKAREVSHVRGLQNKRRGQPAGMDKSSDRAEPQYCPTRRPTGQTISRMGQHRRMTVACAAHSPKCHDQSGKLSGARHHFWNHVCQSQPWRGRDAMPFNAIHPERA
mmetsp:Transcript_81428/g.226813  ORF Transcript_81428/g.226813 Transcript_81428/m.226813 type:complete len:207 (+) Transcript_81428:428-1048(+)